MNRLVLLRLAWAVVLAGEVLHGRACRAEVRPAACFGDHMVVQQGMPVPVWGQATPGERVIVEFGAARAEAVADAGGSWRVALPAQAVSKTPRALVIQGSNRVEFADVLVGEVWLCAGQSNMLLPLAKCDNAKRELVAADRPLLRVLMMRTAATGDRPAYTPDQVRRLEPQGFCTGEWVACTPAAAGDFSGVGYFLGARLLDALDVPVGIVCVAVGGTPTEAWVRREALAADAAVRPLVRGDWTRNPDLAGWCVDRATENLARARRAGERIPGDELGPNHPFKPGFMWEAGMAPLVPLAIRGIAWYQGESNADSPARVAQHARLFPVLVRDWRRAWNRDDLPFAAVQLPGMNRPDWPAFRETQRRAIADLSHAGLVVTIDLGKKDDVHPGDKRPVGERLAAWALAEVHAQPGVMGTAPSPADAEFRGDGSIVLRFHPAAGGLRTVDGESPRHFEVAGPDRVFRAAAAARIDGDCVVVEPATESSHPMQIRYAWLPVPEPPVNLVNAAGLPATPFLLQRDARRAD
jgi:sialate O-acetylesterase